MHDLRTCAACTYQQRIFLKKLQGHAGHAQAMSFQDSMVTAVDCPEPALTTKRRS